jgi:hypothetical protein
VPAAVRLLAANQELKLTLVFFTLKQRMPSVCAKVIKVVPGASVGGNNEELFARIHFPKSLFGLENRQGAA